MYLVSTEKEVLIINKWKSLLVMHQYRYQYWVSLSILGLSTHKYYILLEYNMYRYHNNTTYQLYIYVYKNLVAFIFVLQ